jgi:uncharacterized damage-inducible protein DinB
MSIVMTELSQIALKASYNTWMNAKLYEAAGRLSNAELMLDRKAFFGSIFNTLNHLCAGDTNWLKRFAAHSPTSKALDPIRSVPTPTALTTPMAADLAQLWSYRQLLDGVIEQWTAELGETDLQSVLRYNSMNGDSYAKPFDGVLLHFFNHQTHHRGQASTLLFQAGQDIGATDLIVLVPNC